MRADSEKASFRGRDLKARGLKVPRLMIADGHLGIWSALSEILPESQQQRCWNHKILNVLDGLPKKEQPTAKELLRRMASSKTQAECEKQRDAFVKRYQKSYPKAAETLARDWERMITFYAFPKEHWPHSIANRCCQALQVCFQCHRDDLETPSGRREIVSKTQGP